MFSTTLLVLCVLLESLLVQTKGSCSNDEIRLVDGRTPYEGRVEYCYNGNWGTICHHFWDHNAAAVVCRQLGLPTEFPTALLNYRGGCGVILLDYVECDGSEDRLSDCDHNPFYNLGQCSHHRDAGVRCLSEAECSEGEVRLQGDRGPNEGRVEICYEGVWSIVCGYKWDYNDAVVLCRELNLPTTVVEAIEGYDAKGADVYVIDELQCTGNESSLFDCPHLRLERNECEESFVAGVKCLSEPQCNETDVRLVGGYVPTVGRVEVCSNGTWGTVCHPSSENDDWTNMDAVVVCRQLGYHHDWAWALPQIGLGSGHVVYTEVECTGNEETLSDCQKSDDISAWWCYTHEYDAGVICLDDYECSSRDIRLMGGPSEYEGRVEFCGERVWRTICSNEWDMNEALVVCRELGYHTGYSTMLPIEEGSLTSIWRGNVQCNGSESSLEDCNEDRMENYACRIVGYEYAGVRCFPEPECNDNAVRLVQNDELESNFSVVQLCMYGMWSFIGGNSWDDTEAAVICAELGFLPLNATGGVYMTFSTSHPVLVDEFHCTEADTYLYNCQYTEIGFDATCRDYHGEATVYCIPRECNQTELRLRGGNGEYDGRVEVCVGGVWVTVCDEDTWDLSDAIVVCTQLGYSSGSSYPVKIYSDVGSIAQGSLAAQSYHIDNVQCSGSEKRLDLCPHTLTEATACPSHYEAGVICTAPVCVEGSVRVVGSYRGKEGRVEYCYNGQWHAVCSDNWNKSHANVVCSSLGYSTDQEFESTLSDNFGRGMSPLLSGAIECGGDEVQLSECMMTPLETCAHVAGVICEAPCRSSGIVDCAECDSTHPCPSSPSLLSCQCTSDCFSQGSCCSDVSTIPNCLVEPGEGCVSGSVRLAGGVTNSSSGRVEVCVSGVWGSVCDRAGGWQRSSNNAAIICRQLGLPTDGAQAVESSLFGEGDGPVLLSSVQCVGSEEELLSCLHAGIGSHKCGEGTEAHGYDVGVICADDCDHGEVRLGDGTAVSNGRVEVCMDGVWGRVCSDQWDNVDASVVCSQLGFNDQGALATDVFGVGDGGPVFLSEVQCTGSGSRLILCPSLGLGQHSCTAEMSTGVFCDMRGDAIRCLDELGTPPDTQNSVNSMERFGVCELYSGDAAVCDKVLTPQHDYVYIPRDRGTQQHISDLLNSALPRFTVAEAGDYCRDQIYRIVCNYYLIPCGNDTSRHPPSSICPEECMLAQETCRSAWEAVRLAMASTLPFIDCNDTSLPLIPLPNCCTGEGITAEQQKLPQQTSTPGKGKGTATGTIVGISLGCVIAVLVGGAVSCAVYKLRRRKKDYTQRMQSSVLQISRNSAFVTNPMSDMPSPQDTVFEGATLAVSNLYSKTHGVGPKHNVPLSPYLRQLSRQMLIKHGQLTLLQHIGQGEFGIVYKAKLTHRMETSTVAVKTLKGYFDQSEIDKIMEESLKMKRFQHRHVMGLVGVCLDAGPAPYIIMPYMANGSLHSYLKKERMSLVLGEDSDEDTIEDVRKRLTVMCSQIADGMTYLASEKFVHRDLAARNCMIDFNFVIKITDFGLSEDTYAQNYFRQSSSGECVKLPVKWMAPESLSDGLFSEKSDVWSYGITLWEIFSGGKTPYPGVDPSSLVRLLDRGERMNKPDNSACNHEIFDVMQQCWEYEPEKRPTFTELYSTMVSYIEKIAGYLEMNFNTANPLLPTADTSATNTNATAVTTTASDTGNSAATTIISNMHALLSAADPHSGDEQLSEDSDEESNF